MSQATGPGSFFTGARVQLRVIGALIVRELHTRFGRENVGFMWFILEPMMLALGITAIHAITKSGLPEGLETIPFYISGYVAFMMYRSNSIRAASTVLSNRVLMYHRQVTLFDLMISRTVLELAASFIVLLLLLYGAAAMGLSPWPERPLLLVAGMVMMFWMTTGIAMIVCAGVEFFPNVFERLITPFVYLSLPFSGMFFRINWLPESAREVLIWFPLPQIIDIVRLGVWGHLKADYINPMYLVSFCAILTLIGMFALGAVRSRIKFA